MTIARLASAVSLVSIATSSLALAGPKATDAEWIMLRCTPIAALPTTSPAPASPASDLGAVTLTQVSGSRATVAKVFRTAAPGEAALGQWNVSWKPGEVTSAKTRADVYTDDATGGSTFTLTLLSFAERKDKANARAQLDGQTYPLFCKYASRSF